MKIYLSSVGFLLYAKLCRCSLFCSQNKGANRVHMEYTVHNKNNHESNSCMILRRKLQ